MGNSEMVVAIARSPDGMEQEMADFFGRKVAVLLVRGNWDAARAVVGEARRIAQTSESEAPLDMCLANCDVAPEAAAALERGLGIIFVRDLKDFSRGELERVPQMNERRVERVEKCYLQAVAASKLIRAVDDCNDGEL